MFVDEVLQGLGEFGGVAQRAVDERVAHDLATHVQAGLWSVGHGKSLLWCWRRQARRVVYSKNASRAGST
ncbi:hypothetical protein D3C80_1989890 [compost metagenome]